MNWDWTHRQDTTGSRHTGNTGRVTDILTSTGTFFFLNSPFGVSKRYKHLGKWDRHHYQQNRRPLSPRTRLGDALPGRLPGGGLQHATRAAAPKFTKFSTVRLPGPASAHTDRPGPRAFQPPAPAPPRASPEEPVLLAAPPRAATERAPRRAGHALLTDTEARARRGGALFPSRPARAPGRRRRPPRPTPGCGPEPPP